MNNRGFLKIVEAIIAITLIISVMFVYFNRSKPQVEVDFSEKARFILEEVSRNTTIRDVILNNQTTILNAFIQTKIPEQYLSFEARICDLNDVCGKGNYTSGSVYSAERTISSTINNYNPKKVRLFIWEKQ